MQRFSSKSEFCEDESKNIVLGPPLWTSGTFADPCVRPSVETPNLGLPHAPTLRLLHARHTPGGRRRRWSGSGRVGPAFARRTPSSCVQSVSAMIVCPFRGDARCRRLVHSVMHRLRACLIRPSQGCRREWYVVGRERVGACWRPPQTKRLAEAVNKNCKSSSGR